MSDATVVLFFDNHGAVAGVFTVVGLVVLVIVTALVTNAVRRRRAQKFDQDVAEAAREAAAAAHASPPDFHDFDDEDYVYGNSSGSNGGMTYTDTTHNTNMTRQTSMTHGSFNQPPMQPSGPFESYGMAELPVAGAGLGVGAAYPGVVGGADLWNANANTAGVGAAGLNRSRSTTTPYNAFAGPPVGGYEPTPPPMPVAHPANADPFHDAAGIPVGGVYNPMPQPQPYASDGIKEAGILTAAGLGGAAGAAAVTTARDQGSVHSRTRSKSGKSIGNGSGSGSGNGTSQGSPTAVSEHDESSTYNPYEYSAYPPAKYQPPSYPQQPLPMALQPSVAPQQQSQQQKGVGARPLSTATSLGGEDPYAAYTSASPSHDQFSANHSDHNEEDEDEESDEDDDDYRYGRRRVLKVANE
ncbi:hypothetical protein BDY19DRAFT_998828 [Irpex rosettiformis]|uniref:Uncharacterized protein n=1 Tax=Irpex rosettiformis TaxID=378272 RepID=A0ACB8TMD8_9APHY|nr:hypothetical protein BDY19DRAFT_998828 [Irpex rosettiformis]